MRRSPLRNQGTNYFGIQLPPRPFSQLSIYSCIFLDGPYCHCTVQDLLHLPPRRESPRLGLHTREDIEQHRVAAFFKLSKHARFEEYLRVADLVVCRVQVERINHPLCCLLTVHISARQDAGREDLVSLAKLNKRQTVWISKTSNTDTFQHTVTP